MVAADVRPRGPYSLALSGRLAGDATRTFRDSVFDAVLPAGRARAWQRPDGVVSIRATSDEAVDQLRFVLALDDDHTPFLVRFLSDAMLGRTIKHARGLRPVRVATVAHALLRALCGQLIESRRARSLERKIIESVTPHVTDWRHAPPTCADLGRVAPAKLRQLGLHARRGATLARLCRSVELERLRALPTAAAAERLERERGLGPWSVGVICLEGLGRFERGLTGDLGLVKLLRAMRGREVEGWETEELLEPYGEWAGLASVYLLFGYSRGLVPVGKLCRGQT